MTDTTLANNTTDGGLAGGIENGHDINAGPETATLVATDCTFSGNAGDAGGGGLFNLSSATIANCTFAGNFGTSGGGIQNIGNLQISDSTIANNRGNTTQGIGIYSVMGTLTINNSIVAGNNDTYNSTPVPSDISGTVSGGYNLIGTGGSGGLSDGVNGNRVGVADPKLGPLADNGGYTQTLALLAGSPAINAGSNALIPAGLSTDQRGLPRVSDGTVDIGAYEVLGPIVVNTTADGFPTDGTISLRQAFAWADADKGPDAIQISFDPVVFAAGATHTILLTQGQLELRNSSGTVALNGPGAGILSISGNAASRVFYFDSGVNVTVSNLTVTDGHAPDGAPGHLNPNQPDGGDGAPGGGIFIAGGTVLLSKDVIQGNTAGNGGGQNRNTDGPGGAGGDGGGVYIAGGSITFLNDTLSSNSAGKGGDSGISLSTTGNASNGGDGGRGGALFLAGGTLAISGSSIAGNTAGNGGMGGTQDIEGTAGIGGRGGSGGGIYLAGGTVTLGNATLADNVAGNAGSGGQDYYGKLRAGATGGSGGGIYIDSATVFSVSDTIQHNAAGNGGIAGTNGFKGGLDASGGDGGSGGAIYVASGILQSAGDTIIDNVAGNAAEGAADLELGFTQAGGSGGGIALVGGSLTATQDTIANNSSGAPGSGGLGSTGGGLCVNGGNARLTADTFAANSAYQGDANGAGAAIYITSASLTMINDTLTSNTLSVAPDSNVGTNSPYASLAAGPGSTAQLTGVTIAQNRVMGVFVSPTTTDVTLYNTLIAQNTGGDIGGTLDSGLAPGQVPSSYNLVGDSANAGGLTDGSWGNIVGVADPMLLPLANYGGPTETMPPATGSPAVNAGGNGLVPAGDATDQRGLPRIQGGAVDIGAVEVQPPAAPTNLRASAGADEITLTWTAVPGATYDVYRGSTLGGEDATPIAAGLTSVRFADPTVLGGNTYYYQVTAVSPSGESARSNEASAEPSFPVINGTSSNDSIVLFGDPDNVHIDWSLGATRGQVRVNDPAGLTINGNEGSDSITLNNASGRALPAFLHLNGTFTISGLQTLNGTTLDIGRSTVFINYAGSPDPISFIRQELKAGYNGGAWNGIASSASGVITTADGSSSYGIGYADSTDHTGVNPVANTIELKYTVAGDANLDGTVNLADYLIVSRNFGRGGSWDTGDFNYDGITNLLDILVLSRSFGKNLPAAAMPSASPSGLGVAARRTVR